MWNPAKEPRKNNYAVSHPIFRPSSAAPQSRNPRRSPLRLRSRSPEPAESATNLGATSAHLFLRGP